MKKVMVAVAGVALFALLGLTPLPTTATAHADDEDYRLAVGACGVLQIGFTVAQAVNEVEEKLAEDGYPPSQARAQQIVARAAPLRSSRHIATVQ